MAKRFFVDIKETSNGDLTGAIKFPSDSTFCLEVLSEVLLEFSKSCEVPPEEIVVDLLAVLRAAQGIELQ